MGCATTVPVSKMQQPESAHLDLVINQLVEKISLQVPQYKKPLKILMTDFSNLERQDSNLEKYLTEELSSRFSRTTNFNVLQRSQLDRILSEMRINLTDLGDPTARREFARHSGVDVIFSGTTERSKYEKVIRLSAWLVDLQTGNKIAEVKADLQMEKRVRQLLGEKLPGKLLVITHPAGTDVFLDSERQGITELDGLSIEIPYGSHTVRINKAGYNSFLKSIFMEEEGYKKLEVKFETDEAAPIKAMLASAILPGLGGAFYGKAKTPSGTKRPTADAWLALSTFTFYVGGIAYVIDEINKPNFYISKHQNDYNRIKGIEQKIAIASYAINLISSIAVGSFYAKQHRAAKEVSFLNHNPAMAVSLSQRDYKIMLISACWHF